MSSQRRSTGAALGRPAQTPPRKVALIFGVLFLITFVVSIAAVILYAPVLHPAKYIVGAGADTRVRLGAVCELILIIANVGTAVVVFPILKRQNEILALGYVTARIAECTFIAIGIVSLLAVVTLRHKAAGADAGSLVTTGKALVAIRNWTFVLGPGFVVGVGNGLILGYLMYRSGLVPRGMAMLGLVGGPLVCLSGIAVVFDVIGRGSAAQFVATIPEILWELSLGIYPHRQRLQGIPNPRRDPLHRSGRRLAQPRGGCAVIASKAAVLLWTTRCRSRPRAHRAQKRHEHPATRWRRDRAATPRRGLTSTAAPTNKHGREVRW